MAEPCNGVRIASSGGLKIVPISFRQASEYIRTHHRHHAPPQGMKFCLGVADEGGVVGVLTAGRPVSRVLDDGATVEITRSCTDGTPNANSMLYGAAWRVARGMGYIRAITYTQEGESGISMRAAGWVVAGVRPARLGWADSSVKMKAMRNSKGNGGVARTLWRVGKPLNVETMAEVRLSIDRRA